MKYRPYRQSSISTFHDCPRAFYLGHVLGNEGGNQYTREGVRLHKLFEDALIAENAGTPSPPFVGDEWRAWHRVAPIVAGGTPEKIYYIAEHGGGINPDDALLRGQIDVDMNDGSTFFDYKMGATGFDDSRSDKKYGRQADFYMCLLWANGKMGDPREQKTATFTFLFPMQNLDEKTCPSKTITYNLSDMPELWEQVKRGLLEFEVEVSEAEMAGWPMHKSACKRCLYAEHCTVTSQPVQTETGVVQMPKGELSPANIKQAVETLFTIRGMEKYAAERIEAYINANGSVVLDGGTYGYFPKSKRVITDKMGLINRLLANDVNKNAIIEAMTLGVGKAEKLAGKLDLSEFITVEKTEELRFKPRKE